MDGSVDGAGEGGNKKERNRPSYISVYNEQPPVTSSEMAISASPPHPLAHKRVRVGAFVSPGGRNIQIKRRLNSRVGRPV